VYIRGSSAYAKLPPITNGHVHIYPLFLGTFPRPKTTIVKEPILKKKFDVCNGKDLYGGIDINF